MMYDEGNEVDRRQASTTNGEKKTIRLRNIFFH